MLVDSKKLVGRPIFEEDKTCRKSLGLARTRDLVSYSWRPSGRVLLVPADGDLWLAPFRGERRRLAGTEAIKSGLLEIRELS